MKSSLLKSFFFAVAACLLTAQVPLSAQDQQNITLQFLSFPRANNPDPVELLIPGKEPIEVEIPTNRLSRSYTVPKSSEWVVGETVVGEDGKKAFNVLGRANALNAESQLLLLIRKGKDSSDGFLIRPMNNNESTFGGGHFLFMNATNLDIAGQVGGEKFAIRTGKHSIILPRSESGENSFHAMFYFRSENETKPFLSTRWPVSESARSLVFFYNDPSSERIRLHSIRSYR